MNNKGFMMAEVVVVASVILVTLTGIYLSYNKILSIYNQRVNYYDVATLYRLAYIRDVNYEDIIIDKAPQWDKITNQASTNENVYYIDSQNVKDNMPNNINQTFKDYIEYLEDSITSETNNVLVMEKCSSNNDKCKYAYLEVYE